MLWGRSPGSHVGAEEVLSVHRWMPLVFLAVSRLSTPKIWLKVEQAISLHDRRNDTAVMENRMRVTDVGRSHKRCFQPDWLRSGFD
jgi:hypothetical protein